jgi:CubicO group peptidase (beta-lactamase class C family)
MNAKTQMERVIHGSYANTAGMVVFKEGQKVYENYYNGFSAANKIHIASVTKSIVSALMGIAIDMGYIKSLNEPILTYFPEYKVRSGEQTIQKITIKDMMTMTAPYRCKTEPYVKVLSGYHWIDEALNLLGGKGKIGDFTYSPMIGIHVLSGILVKATGQNVLDFATKYLFNPLEIHVDHNIILLDKEETIAFNKDRNTSGWVVDPEGINTAGWGLTLAPEDIAKIGQLYLDHGRWNGKQIVSEQWIIHSTSVQSHCKQWDLSYGYLWWIIDEKKKIYAAMGDGGNIIYVNTAKKLVIAIACIMVPNAKDRIKLIKDYVEPVFDSCE